MNFFCNISNLLRTVCFPSHYRTTNIEYIQTATRKLNFFPPNLEAQVLYWVAYIDLSFANINRLLAAFSDNRPVHSMPNVKHYW
jgi:hypothetical protein